MHDNKTVAFEIRLPFFGRAKCKDGIRRKDKFKYLFITIWHVDPEIDGSDDSCGFTFPKLSDEIKKRLYSEAEHEFAINNFFDLAGRPVLEPIAMVYLAYQLIAWRIYKEDIKPKYLPVIISDGSNIETGLRSFTQNNEMEIEEFKLFFYCTCRCYARMRREWWKHPKWHIHHWKIQIHPLQSLIRWIFKRCYICGKRFGWSEPGYAKGWESKEIAHGRCREKNAF